MKHLYPLTSLRFFAAAAIVIGHMKDILPLQETFPFYRLGILAQGVSFFFVLSGFILVYVYGQGLNIRQFYLNRFARLWPIHGACFILSVALLNLPALNTPQWPLIMSANLVMIHAWIPVVGFPFAFNGPSWSISTEFAFYLFFPLLIHTRHFKLVYVIIVIVVLSSLGVIEYFNEPSKPVRFTFSYVHLVIQHPLIRILEFATGVAVGRLYLSGWKQNINGTALEISIITMLFVYWSTITPIFMVIRQYSSVFALWYSQSGGFILFAAAVLIFASGRGIVSRLLSQKVFVLLGKISFSTYMFHYIVIRCYAAAEISLPWYWTAIIVLPIIYLGSYILWRYVEEPARRKILSIAHSAQVSNIEKDN